MTFVGWMLVGSGVLLLYSAVRNLSVLCLLTSVLQGKNADCTNK